MGGSGGHEQAVPELGAAAHGAGEKGGPGGDLP